MVNLFIVYELDSWPRDLDTEFAIVSCLFGGVKLTKNADPDNYVYSGYGIEFDTKIEYSLPDDSEGKIFITFGADISALLHVDNKGKDILIIGKGITQGLNNTTLVAETLYSTNFTRSGIKFSLSLHYNGTNHFLFINATKIYQFKEKDSEKRKFFS